MTGDIDDETFLIRELSADAGVHVGIPGSESERRCLIRSLMNIRAPTPLRNDLMEVQDRYLSRLLEEKALSMSTSWNSMIGYVSGRGTSPV